MRGMVLCMARARVFEEGECLEEGEFGDDEEVAGNLVMGGEMPWIGKGLGKKCKHGMCYSEDGLSMKDGSSSRLD
jgi:hypothetical protein